MFTVPLIVLFCVIVSFSAAVHHKRSKLVLSIPREPNERKALLISLFPAVRDYYKDPSWGKVRQVHTRPEVLESNTTLFKSIINQSIFPYICSIRYIVVENKDFYVLISPETHFSMFMTPKRKFRFTTTKPV